MDSTNLPPYRDYPDEKVDTPAATAGVDGLPTFHPPQASPTSSFSTRTRKTLAGLAGGLLVLGLLAHPIRHELSRVFTSEFSEGWGYTFRGEGFDWKKHHNHREHWDHDMESSIVRDYSTLKTMPIHMSTGLNNTLKIGGEIREIIIDLDESSDAVLTFRQGEAASIYVEQTFGDGAGEGVQGLLGEFGQHGLLIRPEDDVPRSYLIDVTLPAQKSCKPISLFAHGAALSVSVVDLLNYNFKNFVLTSSAESDVVVKNLHAQAGHISLDKGGIHGSFNVSHELILKSALGDIKANISIFEPSHHGHGHPHHNKTLEEDNSAYKHEHHAPSSPPGPPPPGPPPHGPDSHPSGPPHHPPHGLVKVFAGTGIGSVDLLYVDAQISNRTTLISKAKASIGDVTVGVLHGFKGLLLEGARIGEVGFKNPGNTTIHVVKEVHRGPGGFIKAFIGPKPPHPPKHHHHKKPKKDKKDKKDKKEHKKHLREHHHKHADAKEEDDDEETDLFRDHPDVPDSPPPPPPPHGPEGPEHHGHPDGPPHPPPPPGKGPHGPPPHHGPHPPPGYGVIAAFTETGKTEVVFY